MNESSARAITLACIAGIVVVLVVWADRYTTAHEQATALPTGVVIAAPSPRRRGAPDPAASRNIEPAPVREPEQIRASVESKTTAMLADPGTGRPWPAERLTRFQPATLGGLKRVDTAFEHDDTAGSPAAIARARYTDGGREFELRIADLGGPRGIVGFAGWALSEPYDTANEEALEQVWHDPGRVHYRQYDNLTMTGEASVLLGDRIAVTVTARGARLPAIAAALGEVDLAGLEALARMR